MPNSPSSSRPGRRRALVVFILLLIILSPLGYSVVHGVIHEEEEPFLDRPDPKYKTCIWNMSGDEMRAHHWEHLRRIRENVVRYGNRTEEGLARCKDCHLYRDRFCDRCHRAVSLTPDCFDCHYYPTSDQQASASAPPAAAPSAGSGAPQGVARLREGKAQWTEGPF